jgi:two-component system, OmpR family, sensor histidine kinase BaeS
MKMSLRQKLSISYISVVAVAVLLIIVLSNLFIEKQFTEYVSQNQEKISKSVVESISKQYLGDNKWTTNVIESIGVDALKQGMIVSINDAKGKKIWDARIYNNGMCNQMLEHMSTNMSQRYHNSKGGYQENNYPIYDKTKLVGTVKIGYYGPVYFTDNDLLFINTFNKITIGVGVAALLFALFISMLMARRISNPVSKVINKAHMIAKGNYERIDYAKSDIKEITDLSETINYLSETLEEQELLRKRLTADVAHELRTPIATLQSHMEAMIDGIWEADTQRLTSCHEEITRIGRMIGDLEKLSKYENERIVLNKEKVEIYELIRNIILNFQTEFDRKGIKIEVEGTAKLKDSIYTKGSKGLLNSKTLEVNKNMKLIKETEATENIKFSKETEAIENKKSTKETESTENMKFTKKTEVTETIQAKQVTKDFEVSINADKDKISQVIINLVSNALKYTEENGSVKINIAEAEQEGMVVISVKDNGIGISKEDLPFIFERFYRADKSRSRMTGGSGIGLTITKSIIDAHRGKIEVLSELGEGIEVKVYLPKR